MKHRTITSILLSFAIGLVLYAAILPDAKPEPKDPVPTASPAPTETESPTDGNNKDSSQPLKDLDERTSS